MTVTTCQAIVFSEPDRVEVQTSALTGPRPGGAVIRAEYAGVRQSREVWLRLGKLRLCERVTRLAAPPDVLGVVWDWTAA